MVSSATVLIAFHLTLVSWAEGKSSTHHKKKMYSCRVHGIMAILCNIVFSNKQKLHVAVSSVHWI